MTERCENAKPQSGLSVAERSKKRKMRKGTGSAAENDAITRDSTIAAAAENAETACGGASNAPAAARNTETQTQNGLRITLTPLLVMLLWGLLFPLVKLGYRVYGAESTGDILTFAGLRFTVCGAVICGGCFVKKRAQLAAARRVMPQILLSGLFAVILHYGFTYIGLKLTDSSKTAILKQVGVLFYICFSWLFIADDRVTLRKIAGAAAGFLGIAAANLSQSGISWHIGDVLIIAASFCTVISNVISKRLFAAADPICATGISQLFGGAALTAVGVMLGGSIHAADGVFPILLFVGICAASTVSYCLWFVTVKRGSLSKLFIFKFAEPAFAGIFGALLLGEDVLSVRYLLCFLLICGGICISSVEKRRG